MRPHAGAGMSLYGPSGGRKDLNAAERRRFIKAANRADPETRLFCLVLGWSRGRISEVLALTAAAIDIESGVANIETLKRRERRIVRQVPLPRVALCELNHFFRLGILQRDPDLAVALFGPSCFGHNHLLDPMTGFALPQRAAVFLHLGRQQEALAAGREAVAVYRRLAETRPDAFLPNLAGSLAAHGYVLFTAGRYADAGRAFR